MKKVINVFVILFLLFCLGYNVNLNNKEIDDYNNRRSYIAQVAAQYNLDQYNKKVLIVLIKAGDIKENKNVQFIAQKLKQESFEELSFYRYIKMCQENEKKDYDMSFEKFKTRYRVAMCK